jgi:hypothetical protein
VSSVPVRAGRYRDCPASDSLLSRVLARAGAYSSRLGKIIIHFAPILTDRTYILGRFAKDVDTRPTGMSQAWRLLVGPVACCDNPSLLTKRSEAHNGRGESQLAFSLCTVLTGDLQSTVCPVIERLDWPEIK